MAKKCYKERQNKFSLLAKRDELFSKIINDLQNIASQFAFVDIELLTSEQELNIDYPVLEYPTKVTSLNFNKSKEIAGTLLGLKGQYLILDIGVF